MDFLKSQSGRLQQQFAQLTASQKMLSVSLVIIMAMTLVWWGRYAGQAGLAPMIRGFTDVRNAMVVIDATEKRSFSNPITAKATVSIKMKPGKKADSRMVNAAADVVVGGVAGLKRSGVRVIIDGISRLS